MLIWKERRDHCPGASFVKAGAAITAAWALHAPTCLPRVTNRVRRNSSLS